MYDYSKEKPAVFTEDGQRTFLQIRDRVQDLIKKAGCVRMGEAISGSTGSSWTMMACVDRLVELSELVEIPQKNCAGQHRIFRAAYR